MKPTLEQAVRLLEQVERWQHKYDDAIYLRLGFRPAWFLPVRRFLKAYAQRTPAKKRRK